MTTNDDEDVAAVAALFEKDDQPVFFDSWLN